MPSKSRRKRGKQSYHGKKRKGKLAPIPKTVEQATASQTNTLAESEPVRAPMPVAARYPYVTSELKRIGIISAIMIAVLVILSQVLV